MNQNDIRAIRPNSRPPESSSLSQLPVVQALSRRGGLAVARPAAFPADEFSAGVQTACGARSLHEQSHGESVLSLAQNRFGGDGLYLLDEPEAALPPSRRTRRFLENPEKRLRYLLSEEG